MDNKKKTEKIYAVPLGNGAQGYQRRYTETNKKTPSEQGKAIGETKARVHREAKTKKERDLAMRSGLSTSALGDARKNPGKPKKRPAAGPKKPKSGK